MARFSVREAAFAGVRVIRERPGILIPWALFMIACELFWQICLFSMAGRSPARLDVIGKWNPILDITGAELSGPARYFVPLFLCVFIALAQSATNRAVLRNTARGFGYFRLGMDEIRQIALLSFLYLSVVATNLTVTSGLPILWGVITKVDTSPINNAVATVIAFFILVRLSLASAVTFHNRQINLRESWRLTRGQFWSLVLALGSAFLVAAVANYLWTKACYEVLGLLNGGDQYVLARENAHPDMRSLATYLTPAKLEWIVIQAPSGALFWPIVLAPLASVYRQLSGHAGSAASRDPVDTIADVFS